MQRLFWLFGRLYTTDQHDLMHRMCALACDSSEHGILNAFVPFTDISVDGDRWSWTLARFTQHLVQYGLVKSQTEQDRCMSLVDVENWELIQQHHPAILSLHVAVLTRVDEACRGWYAKFMDALCQLSTWQQLANYLKGTHDRQCKTNRFAAHLIVLLLKTSHFMSKEALQSMSTSLLSVAALPDRLPHGMFEQLSKSFPLDRLLQQHALALDVEERNQAHTMRLLANLAALSCTKTASMSSSELHEYLNVLIRLLQSLTPDAFKDKDEEQDRSMSMHHESDDSEDEEAESAQHPVAPKQVVWMDPQLKPHLLKLLHAPHVLGIFAMDKRQPSDVMHACNFILLLLHLWPACRYNLLLTCIYGMHTTPSLVQTLYHVIAASPLAALSSRKAISLEYMFTNAHLDVWPVMLVFCELTSRALMTMTFEEFFQGSQLLDMDQITPLAILLKVIAFNLIWNSSSPFVDKVSSALHVGYDYLIQTTVHLLQQLHIKNTRRPFMSPNDWYMEIPELASTTFSSVIQEYQDEEKERDLLQKGTKGRLVPRLLLLKKIPFVLPFLSRVQLFRELVMHDRQSYQDDMTDFDRRPIEIKRTRIFRDGYRHFNQLGRKLKRRIKIEFIDAFGLPEAGVDGGGVFKEFLTELGKEAFNENYGLFKVNHERLLYPNPDIVFNDEIKLDYYEFIGRVLGKALYEGILVDAEFAGFFLAKCLGKQNHLDDLPSLDPQLYKGLIELKNHAGDVTEWGLDFTITDDHMGTQVTHELVPHGKHMTVTNENRLRYIYLVANYRLNVQIERQCKAFFHGLSDLIHPLWLKLFDQQELQILIGGATRSIDIEDLKQNTVYGKDYSDSHPAIRRFWAVVESFDDDMKRQLVKFITSCSRPPLLGFSELHPKLSIQNTGEQSIDRLPTSSTCINLLKLPPYTSFEAMKTRLTYAVQAAAGFDLS